MASGFEAKGYHRALRALATTASYTYNSLDTRVSKIENSVTTNFVRDGVGVTAPVIRDTFASYTPGTSERRNGATTFSHSGLKNAELQTDSAKATTATKQYDAFGNLVSSTGTWNGAFGYAGGFGYQEDASGLKLLGHRYYDSSTGRFITRDPAKDGRNWYAYCDSDPLMNVDPRGLDLFGIGKALNEAGEWVKGRLKGWEKLIPGIIEAIIIGPILPGIIIEGPFKISPWIVKEGGGLGLGHKELPGIKFPIIKFGGGKEEEELKDPEPIDFGPPQHSTEPALMEPPIPGV